MRCWCGAEEFADDLCREHFIDSVQMLNDMGGPSEEPVVIQGAGLIGAFIEAAESPAILLSPAGSHRLIDLGSP